MKLKTIILKNFRCYKDETRIEVGDLTAFIGVNDIGKSSILEALEIFVNNDLVKIEKLDACVSGDEADVRIGCVFTNYPPQVVIDTKSTTTLEDEYLLNQDGGLEIHKRFDCSGSKPKEEVFAVAHHPTAELAHDLLLLMNDQLKDRLRQLSIEADSVDLRSNTSIRKAIWKNYDCLNLDRVEIPLNDEDAKKIWNNLQKYLPTLALFQADRPSTDEDAEVQDPMKLAVTEAIRSVEKELESIKRAVREKATAVAKRTLEKLREMDPTLAQELSPHFKAEPKWKSLFKLTLTSDDQIPINKRGSGVRRLILLNFFRAEAERKQKEANSPGIIYAIEEPETSQHPFNQKMLLEAFLELSQQDNCQVILTTHVPGLAGLLPLDNLRYVKKDERGEICICFANEEVYKKIANELGVLSDSRVQVLVCVEGPNDVNSLKHISKMLHCHDSTIPDLSTDDRVALLPLGGANLKQWVEKHYLKNLGRPEIHIYDRGTGDPPKFQQACAKVNNRSDDSWATLTQKREMENYLHPDTIKDALGVQVAFTDNDDVPLLIAKSIHDSDSSSNPWCQLTDEKRNYKEKNIKRRLNDEVASAMTYERLVESDPDGDIETWLREIAKRLS